MFLNDDEIEINEYLQWTLLIDSYSLQPRIYASTDFCLAEVQLHKETIDLLGVSF